MDHNLSIMIYLAMEVVTNFGSCVNGRHHYKSLSKIIGIRPRTKVVCILLLTCNVIDFITDTEWRNRTRNNDTLHGSKLGEFVAHIIDDIEPDFFIHQLFISEQVVDNNGI